MRDYEDHPLAEVFPLLSEPELLALAEDVRRNGLKQKIITYEGKILDGRNRYRACKVAGVAPQFAEYSGDDPVAFVRSQNLTRRHLTASQRAMSAARLVQLSRTPPPPPPGTGPAILRVPEAVTQEEAAELFRVGLRSVQAASQVVQRGTDELKQKVESGDLSVHQAAKIAAKPLAEQAPLARPKPPAPPPDRVEEILRDLTQLTRRLTVLIHDDPAGERFVQYLVDLGLSWVDHREVWVEGKTYGKRFVGFHSLRHLLKVSRGGKVLTPAELRAALGASAEADDGAGEE